MPPQIQNQIPTVPPKKISPPVFIWILIILAGLIAVCEIFVGQSHPRKEPADFKVASYSENENHFVNWKKYRNDEYRFEMQIPEDWRVDVQNGAIYLFYSTTGEREAKQKEEECIKKLSNTDTSICANPYTQDLGFFASNIETKPLTRNNMGKVEINGLAWNRYEDGGWMYYELNIGNKGYTFYAKKEETLQLTLSAFRPDLVTDISTWNNYLNKEYGFEFKYPLNAKVISDKEVKMQDGSLAYRVALENHDVSFPSNFFDTSVSKISEKNIEEYLINKFKTPYPDDNYGVYRNVISKIRYKAIGGKTFTFVLNPLTTDDGCGGSYSYISNQVLYEIRDYESCDEVYYSKMLLSFKFTK